MRRLLLAAVGLLCGAAAPLSDNQAPDEPAWRVLGRRNVAAAPIRDVVSVADRGRFEEVRLCAERGELRLRYAEVKLRDGGMQRLASPLMVAPGGCARSERIFGGARAIHDFAFDYEPTPPGRPPPELVIQAR
jgi:hypothetical protein